ncbi:MAG: ATP-dependent Clp protease adapter ClpS [Pseudobdellovibrionaceae bacterium]
MNHQHDNEDPGAGSDQHAGQTQTISRTQKPKMYKVLLLNDDYTPMDFVILILKKYFAKTDEQATEIMLSVHKQGSGLAGVYTLEVAEMKVMQVNQFSQMNQYPLKSVMEEE